MLLLLFRRTYSISLKISSITEVSTWPDFLSSWNRDAPQAFSIGTIILDVQKCGRHYSESSLEPQISMTKLGCVESERLTLMLRGNIENYTKEAVRAGRQKLPLPSGMKDQHRFDLEERSEAPRWKMVLRLCKYNVSSSRKSKVWSSQARKYRLSLPRIRPLVLEGHSSNR